MKVIVYTTIFGGSNSLKPAPKGADLCVCFVDDQDDHLEAKGWELVTRPAVNPRRAAWHLRCVPHQLFDDYDRVVWVDASFTITNLPKLLADASGPISALRHHTRSSCYAEGREIVKVGQASRVDVEAQMNAYRSRGFAPNHLSISCILVRSNTRAVRDFNERWDEEIAKHPGDNTQLSLDYSAWKHGLTIQALQGSRHDNPYATHDGKDHKRRRQPYDTAVA